MTKTAAKKSRALLLIPLSFLALSLTLGIALFKGDASLIPSALIGRSVPEFALPALEGSGSPALSTADFQRGDVVLMNVWASWCVPCRAEHPVLVQMRTELGVKIFGLNYEDKAENASRFLRELSNPYDAIGHDLSGRVGIDWGVYGVPETFIIDGNGIIRYKHIGPLNPQIVETIIKPEIEKAKQPL